MKEKKKSDLAVLLGNAGSYKGLTFLGLGLSAIAMVPGMLLTIDSTISKPMANKRLDMIS